MMWGTQNEAAATNFLRQQSWVHMDFDFGMLCSNGNTALEAAPDEVVVMTADHFDDLVWEEPGCIEVGGTQFLLAVLELTTAVANRALRAQLLQIVEEINNIKVGDTICTNFVPRKHIAQLILQLVVTRFNLAVYLCTDEAGIVSATVINY